MIEQLLLEKPYLIPFKILSCVRDGLIKPDRILKGSGLHVTKPYGKWEKSIDFPNWRYEFNAGVIDKNIVCIGGLTMPTVYTISKRVDVFDLSKKAWIRYPDFPVIIHHPGVVACNNGLYVIGGNGLRITPYQTTFMLTKNTKRWIRRKSMTVKRGALGLCSVAGEIYAIGGGAYKVPLSVLEIYNPLKNEWRRGSDMPTPREHLVVASAQGKIYAMGGYRKSLSGCLSVNEMYDPIKKKWFKKKSVPLAISGATAVGIGKSIFLFGGEQGWAVSGETLEYRTDKDQWYRRKDMPIPRYAMTSVVADNKIHVIGGNPRLQGYIFSMDHSIFTP